MDQKLTVVCHAHRLKYMVKCSIKNIKKTERKKVIVNAKTGNSNDRDEGQALSLCCYPLLAKECLLLVQFPSENSPKNGLNQQEMLSVLQIRMSYCQNAQKVGIHIGYMISNMQKTNKQKLFT